MLIDMHVIKQTQKRNLKKMSSKAWGQIPMFFLPVPPRPRVCPPSETQAVVSPERKTLALLRIPQAFVWHGASCTQGLNWVMLFSTLDTQNSKEGSLSGGCANFTTVYYTISFMFLRWKLRREHKLGDPKFHSGVVPISPGLWWQCWKRVKNEKSTKRVYQTGSWRTKPTCLGTCFGREPCSFKIGQWCLLGNSCSFHNTAGEWAQRAGTG